ncbi:MAG: response regulator transcription factor [Prevotellaceae bacterium]|jgi:DNA-binding response OmpR family regulator|nr:response regulator transcription factor [Prevotellaceae bacterium]
MKTKILIIDDEPDIREILQFNLENEGYEISLADSAETALKMLDSQHFDLLLLDVMMGGMSGFKMADKMRKDGNLTPIIFITAKNTENDMLTGFSTGADDFIRKPFSIREVIARVKSVLRRAEKIEQKPPIVFEKLVIDLEAKTASIDGALLDLTKTEFNILTVLVEKAGRTFTREEILDRAWNGDSIVLERTVDVHIARLRKKLGGYGEHIENRTGYGYRFK